MDELEKHIQENRPDFEVHRARKAALWDKIEAGLEQEAPKRRILPFKQFMRIAAMFIIIAGVAAVLFFPKSDNQQFADSAENAELAELDMYYAPLIQQQVQQVKSNPEIPEVNKTEFTNILNELQSDQAALIGEMKSDLDNDQVMEEIIQNYRIQIQLIEKMMEQLQEEKNTKDEKGIYL